MCGARSSEVQRAEAAARRGHQGRSTRGGGFFLVKYRGFICIFYDTGGLSVFFMIPGVYLYFFMILGVYLYFCMIPGVYLYFLMLLGFICIFGG